jgi:hypothetical protein
MWSRSCPMCFTKVSHSRVLTRSNEVECPVCHALLELSRVSRVLASFGGLFVAFVAAHFLDQGASSAAWVMTVLTSFLVFGVSSAALVLIFADLVVRPQEGTTTFPHSRK